MTIALILGFATSLVFSIFIVLTKGWHGKLTMDHAHGIQKVHTNPTPRVGGVSILLAVVVAAAEVQGEVKIILYQIILAGIPAFIFGLAEDVFGGVSVAMRLTATLASGLLAWWITGYSLTRVDVLFIDWILKHAWISVVFTAFAVGGVANSINIIDGLNGLASSMISLAMLGFSIIAWLVNDNTLSAVSLIISVCVFGFFLVNWPFGKIFLGDGGAYFIGFSMAWIAVMLIERNVQVSPFTALLVCFHPVAEVLFSIYRRNRKKQNPGNPDRLHLHSLIKQRYIRRWFKSTSTDMHNSISGVIVGLFTIVSITLAIATYESVLWTIVAASILGLFYVAIYNRIVKHHW